MLQEGQKLYYVGAHRYNSDGREVTIKKVGRKWVTINNGERIDRTTLRADGGEYTSPGRCWLSKADYDAEVNRQSAWDELQKMLRYMTNVPDGVSEVNIRHAISLLKSE